MHVTESRPLLGLALFALVLLTTTTTPTPVTAQDDPVNATAPTPTTDLTLADLDHRGTRPARAPPSVRAGGTYSEYALKVLPTGPFVRTGPNASAWRFLRPWETVKRTRVQLWSKRGYGVEPRNVTVRVAYWERTRRTVREGNTTRTVTVATNVTTRATTATLAGGYDVVAVDLRPQYGERRMVTMCVQAPDEPNCLAHPTGRRWVFPYRPTLAAKTIPARSQGQLVAWALGVIVLPGLAIAGAMLYAGREALDRAAAPPNVERRWYVLGALAAGAVLVAFWDLWVGLTVRNPWLLSLALGLPLGTAAVRWFGDHTFLALFLRFRLRGETDPGPPTDDDPDEDAPEGILKLDAMPVRMTRTDAGRASIRWGLWRFLARVRGAMAYFETDGEVQTRVEVDNGPYEEAYLLDPEAADPLDYEPEGHASRWPTVLDYPEDARIPRVNLWPLVAGGFGLLVGWVAGGLLGSAPLGLVVAAALLYVGTVKQPSEGALRATLAPLHYNHAVAVMLTHAQKLGDARSWETLYGRLKAKEAEHRAEDKALADAGARSQFERLMDDYLDPAGGDGAAGDGDAGSEPTAAADGEGAARDG